MTTAEKDPDDGRLVAPLWEVRDDMVVGGRMYLEGSVVRSWELPHDSRLLPINANAKLVAMYALKVRHHPMRPKSASTRFGLFLPAQLVFGDSVTRLVDLYDDMPRFSFGDRGSQPDDCRVLLGWPGTAEEKGYDKPMNEAAERLLAYWREFKGHDDLNEHSCWCALRDQLWLPTLQKREPPREEKLPAGFGAKPTRAFVASDSRPDSTLVPERPLSSPTPRLRRIRETRAVQLGTHDPTGRR
jgi:hypothetical protein